MAETTKTLTRDARTAALWGVPESVMRSARLRGISMENAKKAWDAKQSQSATGGRAVSASGGTAGSARGGGTSIFGALTKALGAGVSAAARGSGTTNLLGSLFGGSSRGGGGGSSRTLTVRPSGAYANVPAYVAPRNPNERSPSEEANYQRITRERKEANARLQADRAVQQAEARSRQSAKEAQERADRASRDAKYASRAVTTYKPGYGPSGKLQTGGGSLTTADIASNERAYQLQAAANERISQDQAEQNRIAAEERGEARATRDIGRSATPNVVKEAVSSGLGNLVQSYNEAFGRATEANESRYRDLLGTADQDFANRQATDQRMLGVVNQTTGQREADIKQSYREQRANQMQELARTGMANTTIAPTLRAGSRREEQSSLNRLADEMQGTRLGVLGRIGDQSQATKLGIMERREDAFPDKNMISNLVSQIGIGQQGDLLPSILGSLGNLGRNATGGAGVGQGQVSAAGANGSPGVGGFLDANQNQALIPGKGFGIGQSGPPAASRLKGGPQPKGGAFASRQNWRNWQAAGGR